MATRQLLVRNWLGLIPALAEMFGVCRVFQATLAVPPAESREIIIEQFAEYTCEMRSERQPQEA